MTAGNDDACLDAWLTATGEQVSQAAGTNVQIVGDLTITAAGVTMGGAGNFVKGNTNLPTTSTTAGRIVNMNSIREIAPNSTQPGPANSTQVHQLREFCGVRGGMNRR